MKTSPPVILPPCAEDFLGTPREWGFPTGWYEGKMWWSKQRQTMTVVIVKDGKLLALTRPIKWSTPGAKKALWIPKRWIRAFAQYVTQWPQSAEFQRFFCDLISQELRDEMVSLATANRDAQAVNNDGGFDEAVWEHIIRSWRGYAAEN